MKARLGTLFFLINLLIAVSSNCAWACGSNDTGHAEMAHNKPVPTSCCAADGIQEPAHCSENSDACNESHPGQSCPDEDGCGQCHCPGCGVVSASHAGGLLTEPPSILPSLFDSGHAKRQAFYFADHIPEAVYLPIWQPPKAAA